MDIVKSFANAVAERLEQLLISMRCGIIYEVRKDLIQWKGDLMAQLQEVKDILSRIDAATDGIAAKLKDLADKVEAGGLTSAEEAEVVSSLRGEADKLEGLAKDPENPVPATSDTSSLSPTEPPVE